jgi:cytochrome c oxidase subunit 5a
VFEGLKEKTENDAQYKAYVDATEPLRKELGILLREELCE